jgi:hypothetical protein
MRDDICRRTFSPSFNHCSSHQLQHIAHGTCRYNQLRNRTKIPIYIHSVRAPALNSVERETHSITCWRCLVRNGHGHMCVPPARQLPLAPRRLPLVRPRSQNRQSNDMRLFAACALTNTPAQHTRRIPGPPARLQLALRRSSAWASSGRRRTTSCRSPRNEYLLRGDGGGCGRRAAGGGRREGTLAAGRVGSGLQWVRWESLPFPRRNPCLFNMLHVAGGVPLVPRPAGGGGVRGERSEVGCDMLWLCCTSLE